MDEQLKVWTTVGSAGTLSQTDLAKVGLHGSIVQLGTEILPPEPTVAAPGPGAPATPQAALIGATTQAVVRYNVVPVDGLFVAGASIYNLQVRYRGRVTVRLAQVDFETGAEKDLLLVDLPDVADFTHETRGAPLGIEDTQPPNFHLDFVNKAYYVEATLTAPVIAVGHPAAISIIKLVRTVPFQG